MLFSFMVYLNDPFLCKMQHGGTYSDWSRGGWGRDNVPFQKTQDDWSSWLWRSRYKHSDNEVGWCDCGDSNNENIPQSNCLERSVFKRGPSRRTYQICQLETRYPCEKPEDTSKSKKSGKREYKDHASKQARSLYGDKPLTDTCKPIQQEEHCSKRVCRDDRLPSDDAICCRVLQSLGDDLFVEWLTPEELHNVEIALEWEFDWSRAWHGGKVKDKAVAVRMQFDLQRGYKATFLLQKFNHDLAFSAFWYLLDIGEIIQLAHQYSHLKTIRKLCYLSS